ncbi:P3 protein [Monodelphis domestica]|uniref:Solute carrier family 10 member 3 n=1 Tax=Monodelphis domestica TaxID=13616 RepID=F6QFJ1_MONDO|nr:P3 protein [Monodelphis domestica]
MALDRRNGRTSEGCFCSSPIDMLLFASLLSGLLCGVQGEPISKTHLPSSSYLSIGEDSVLEFEFPERTKGIIVVSSRYPGQNNKTVSEPVLSVTSLDTEVLSIKNVTAQSWDNSHFVVSIQSGLAGLAPLHIQLLDLQRDPMLIEERLDFLIKVSPVDNDEDDDARQGGLGRFSESPIVYMLLPLVFVNKCAFGCKVELEGLKGLIKSPHPMLLGIVGQFLLMPLYGFLMAKVFTLPKALALGLIITCSTPGGGGSYLFSLLLGGDVTLAISMTLISTVAATGFMPLSSAIYGRLLSVHETLHIPFSKILLTLLFIAIPISTGMVIKYKMPKVSRILLKVIKPFSVVLILGGLFLACRMGALILADVRLPIVLAGLTVPLAGLLVGHALAACLKLSVPYQRTVSFEVGIQNSLLALAVLQLSFRHLQADQASQAPFIVALSSTSEMLALVIGHLAYNSLYSTT